MSTSLASLDFDLDFLPFLSFLDLAAGLASASESGSLSGSASTFFSGDLVFSAFSLDLFLLGVLDLDFFDLLFLTFSGSGSGTASGSASEDFLDITFSGSFSDGSEGFSDF